MDNAVVTSYLYPEDYTGVAATNLIVGERQTLNPPVENLEFHYILPMATPYFRDSVVLTHITTGRRLNRGVDWAAGHKFESASYQLENTQGGVYASILFYDITLAGQVQLQYQTLGGQWTLDHNTILEILSNKVVDPRSVTYEEVQDKPVLFPPTGHNHPADDFTGMAELLIAQYAVAAAIRDQTQTWLDNPPVLFGLYYLASEIDTMFAALNTKFSKYYTATQIDQKLAGLAAGSSPTDGYTKDQINILLANLSNNFDNYYTSVETDALLKTIKDRLAALVVRETAVEKGLSGHIADHNNPHNETPASIGAVGIDDYSLDKAVIYNLLNAKINKTEVGTNGKRDAYISTSLPDSATGVVGDIWYMV